MVYLMILVEHVLDSKLIASEVFHYKFINKIKTRGDKCKSTPDCYFTRGDNTVAIICIQYLL